MENLLLYLLIVLIKIVGIITLALGGTTFMIWVERKVAARIQNRSGPLYVGPFGLFQPIADGIKLFLKEDIFPTKSDKILFFLAPFLVFGPALMTFAVIPIGPHLQIANVNIGIVFIFAISSLGVFGIVMGGWSSNNKYSLLGGLRSAAQMISYEITLALSIVGVLIYSGSLSLNDIVLAQKGMWFVVPQFLGCALFLVSMFAETNRLPFDLPEAEHELVAGYFTEYSSLQWGLFMMGEYVAMISISSVMVALFFGGWLPIAGIGVIENFLPEFMVLNIMPVVWFLLKVAFFMFLFVWVRWTIPRLRFDQLMSLGWKVLIPLALFNIFLAGVLRMVQIT